MKRKSRTLFLLALIMTVSQFAILFAQTISPPVNSDEKFNMRGLYKNDALNLSGSEIIGDYDGNLMLQYKTPIELPNDLGGDFTLMYNANVRHSVFYGLYPSNVAASINMPEWILGYKGFAVQTFNFETNFYMAHQPYTNPPYPDKYIGEEVPCLIPGYDYTNLLLASYSTTVYDEIQILMADGSLKTFMNTLPNNNTTGMYVDTAPGSKDFGFLVLEPQTDNTDPAYVSRRFYYKNGDGLTYEFVEENVSFNDRLTIYNYNTVSDPKIMYLRRVFNPEVATGSASLELDYALPNNDSTILGRKNFVGIRSVSLQNNPDPYELEMFYNLQTSETYLGASIINNNNSTTLNLQLTPTYNLYDKDAYNNSVRNENYIRIQYINSIADNLGRKDSVLYYPLTYSNIQRQFFTGVSNYFIPTYNMVDTIFYHTGAKTQFDYFGTTFDGSVSCSSGLDLSSTITFCPYNMNAAWRDCYTNMMIKTRAISNSYLNTNKLIKTEYYNYTFQNWRIGTPQDSILNAMRYATLVDSIRTQVTTIVGDVTTDPNAQQINKYFQQYYISPIISDLLDRGKEIKQSIEETVELNGNTLSSQPTGNKMIKTMYYDYGHLVQMVNNAGYYYYNGLFDLDSVNTKYDTSGSSTPSKQFTTKNIYTYNNLIFKSKNISTYTGIDTIKIVKDETYYDPKTEMKYTLFKNFIPDSLSGGNFYINEDDYLNGPMFYANDPWLYKIGLDSLSKSYGVNNNILNSSSYNYFNSGPLIGKLQETIYNPGSRQTWETYEYYSPIIQNYYGKVINKYYGGSLSAINDSKGNRTEFYYPDPIDTTYGYIRQSSGVKTYSAFIHNGEQFRPIKTLTITPAKDTLQNYTSYNNQNKLNYEVGVNNNYSLYTYDSIGRLKGALFPGSFADSTSPYGFGTFGTANSYSETLNGTATYQFLGDVAYSNNNGTINRYDFYLNFPNPTSLTSPSGNAISATLDLYMDCFELPSGYNETFIVTGLSSPTTVSSYSENVNLTIPGDGINRDVLIDVTSIVNSFKQNGLTLYGFQLSTNITQGNQMLHNLLLSGGGGNSLTLEYIVDYSQKAPTIAIIYPSVGNLPFNYSPYINDTSYTIKYTYDDINYKIYDTTRISNNRASFSELVSRYDNDGLGEQRLKSTKNDVGAYEVKEGNYYDYRGLVVTDTNGLGISKVSSYDYLSRDALKLFKDGSMQKFKYIPGNGAIGGQTYTDKMVYTDEDSKTKTTYYDVAGNKVAEQDSTNNPTIFQYDDIYRLTKVTSPAGKACYYTYDDLGDIATRKSPDDSTIIYKYDKYKNLRFSVYNGPVTSNRVVSFNTYDNFNRPIITGLIFGTYWSYLVPDTDYSHAMTYYPNYPSFENYNTDTVNFVKVNMYDLYSATGVFSSMSFPYSSSLENLKGKLVATAFRDSLNHPWSFKVYSYDYLGRVEHLWVRPNGNSNWFDVTTSYDNLSDITQQTINGGQLYIWNNYDKQARLKDVRSNCQSSNYNTATIEASYNYNIADQVISQLNVDTLNYSYDLNRGWLNGTSDPSSRFSEQLTYRLNGNIQQQSISSGLRQLGWSNFATNFSYDGLNRLIAATTTGISGSNESFTYDNDGNFLTKSRTGSSNTYGYISGTNKLNDIDGGDQYYYAYTYDTKGNVTNKSEMLAGSNIYTISSYDRRNLPLTISTPSGTTNYYYDDSGNRFIKKTPTANEFYLIDQTGRELGVYDFNTLIPKFFNLYGNGLIGRVEYHF